MRSSLIGDPTASRLGHPDVATASRRGVSRLKFTGEKGVCCNSLLYTPIKPPRTPLGGSAAGGGGAEPIWVTIACERRRLVREARPLLSGLRTGVIQALASRSNDPVGPQCTRIRIQTCRNFTSYSLAIRVIIES